MNVILPPDLEAFVHDRVKSGEFPTVTDAIVEGVKLLKERADLRSQLAVVPDESDIGSFADFAPEDIIAEGRSTLESSMHPDQGQH